MTQRTLRSKRLRVLLWQAAEGKCQVCGCVLDPDDWHADHIVPWSNVPRTNVQEMQALCPVCNLKKGNRMKLSQCFQLSEAFRPRKQQSKLWQDLLVMEDIVGGRALAELCTGYGKTLAAFGAFGVLQCRGVVDRMLVLVPGDDQRNQFCDDVVEARRVLGIEIGQAVVCEKAPRELINNRAGGYQVYVATYQQLNGDGFFKELLGKGRWLIVPDECHHLYEDGIWAREVELLPRVFTLYLSATPIRSDRLPLLGVPSGPLVQATYHEAYSEEAVRRLRASIEHYYIDVETDRGPERITTEDLKAQGVTDFSEYEVKRQLRYKEGYLNWMLETPLRHLVQRNTKHPGEHQMVVFAMSCKHADYITTQINGLSASMGLDLSAEWIGVGEGIGGTFKTDAENRDTLARFRKGALPVLVQVGKAGEGFNVKRASVLVFVHLIGADGKLLQQIGRGIRRNHALPWEEDDCIVYASADTPIAEIVKTMAQEVADVREAGERESDDDRQLALFDIPELCVLKATHDHTEHIAPDGTHTPASSDDLAFAQRWGVPIEEVMRYVESRGAPRGMAVVTERTDREELTHQQDQVKSATKVLTGNIIRLLRSRGRTINGATAGQLKRSINGAWNKFSNMQHDAMTSPEFAAKHRWLRGVNGEVKKTKGLPSWLTL